MARRIELEIGKLVIHGERPGKSHRIAPAVEAELARLLAAEEAADPAGDGAAGAGARRTLDQAGRVLELDRASLRVPAGASSQAIGAHIARHLHGRLGGTTAPAAPSAGKGAPRRGGS